MFKGVWGFRGWGWGFTVWVSGFRVFWWLCFSGLGFKGLRVGHIRK